MESGHSFIFMYCLLEVYDLVITLNLDLDTNKLLTPAIAITVHDVLYKHVRIHSNNTYIYIVH